MVLDIVDDTEREVLVQLRCSASQVGAGANLCPGRLARSVQCAFSCHFDDHLDEYDGGDLKKEFYCRTYGKGFAQCSCDAALHRCKRMS